MSAATNITPYVPIWVSVGLQSKIIVSEYFWIASQIASERIVIEEHSNIYYSARVAFENDMQAQTSKMKGELLYELHSKTETTTIKDIGPNGIQLEMNGGGQFSGKIHGGHIDTVSINQKTDGTNDWQVKSILNTKDGDMVVVWGGGKGRMAGPQTGTWEGELHFMTQSPKLSWLNNSTGWVEGQGNMATRESSAKVYAKK